MMEVEEFQPRKKKSVEEVRIGMVRRTPGLLNIPELMKYRRGYVGKPIFLLQYHLQCHQDHRDGVPT